MAYSTLLYETDAPLALITLNRPERLNAISIEIVPQFMKAAVHHGLEGGSGAGFAIEKFAQAALCETEDKVEGLSAFLEKREPRWKGR